VAEIAPPLVWYALGIWPAFLSLLLNRTLSAANLQRDILWTTVVTVVLTIALDIALLGPMEQAGLALAATLGVFANAAMLLARMKRHFPSLDLRGLAGRQARLLAAAAAGAVIALLLDLALPTTDLASLKVAPLLILKAAIALGVVGVVARVLAGPELAEGAGAVRSLFGGRRRRGR
jgi:putative peptidoglycan lipid II flippase